MEFALGHVARAEAGERIVFKEENSALRRDSWLQFTGGLSFSTGCMQRPLGSRI